jgi:hypothetical protein
LFVCSDGLFVFFVSLWFLFVLFALFERVSPDLKHTLPPHRPHSNALQQVGFGKTSQN